jgi:hypothetical protein
MLNATCQLFENTIRIIDDVCYSFIFASVQCRRGLRHCSSLPYVCMHYITIFSGSAVTNETIHAVEYSFRATKNTFRPSIRINHCGLKCLIGGIPCCVLVSANLSAMDFRLSAIFYFLLFLKLSSAFRLSKICNFVRSYNILKFSM